MNFTLECVTPKSKTEARQFCLTDCGPADGCGPDSYYETDEVKNDN